MRKQTDNNFTLGLFFVFLFFVGHAKVQIHSSAVTLAAVERARRRGAEQREGCEGSHASQSQSPCLGPSIGGQWQCALQWKSRSQPSHVRSVPSSSPPPQVTQTPSGAGEEGGVCGIVTQSLPNLDNKLTNATKPRKKRGYLFLPKVNKVD